MSIQNLELQAFRSTIVKSVRCKPDRKSCQTVTAALITSQTLSFIFFLRIGHASPISSQLTSCESYRDAWTNFKQNHFLPSIQKHPTAQEETGSLLVPLLPSWHSLLDRSPLSCIASLCCLVVTSFSLHLLTDIWMHIDTLGSLANLDNLLMSLESDGLQEINWADSDFHYRLWHFLLFTGWAVTELLKTESCLMKYQG